MIYNYANPYALVIVDFAKNMILHSDTKIWTDSTREGSRIFYKLKLDRSQCISKENPFCLKFKAHTRSKCQRVIHKRTNFDFLWHDTMADKIQKWVAGSFSPLLSHFHRKCLSFERHFTIINAWVCSHMYNSLANIAWWLCDFPIPYLNPIYLTSSDSEQKPCLK